MKHFPSFTEDQARELAKARDHDIHRSAQIAVLLVLTLAVGFGGGLYKVNQTSLRADRAFETANQILRDRAVEAHKLAEKNRNRSAQAKQAAYAACRGQQEAAIINRQAIQLSIPKFDPSRSAALQAAVHRFYHEIKARDVFIIPKCIKPPRSEEP